MHANYTEVQGYAVLECSKRVYTLNFEPISSSKLRDVDLDGNSITTRPWCLSKTVGNLARDFYRGSER